MPDSKISPDGPLVLAVPSKGRLQENAVAFFARAGLRIIQGTGTRDYAGKLIGLPDVEVRYLSASEIAGQLADGSVHLGITGEDLIREKVLHADSRLQMLTPLGFGHATVVVAVPQAWVDVQTMADLDEIAVEMRVRHGRRLRVATKYLSLTRRFFADKNVSDYRIVESLGATEGAPAVGSAEIIVDITTTGATLAANALKIITDGVILKSEATLVASLKARWNDSQKENVQIILGRIAAEESARITRELRFKFPISTLPEIKNILKSYTLEFSQLGLPEYETIVHCPVDISFELCESLTRAGAVCVTMRQLDYAFYGNSILTKILFEKLSTLDF